MQPNLLSFLMHLDTYLKINFKNYFQVFKRKRLENNFSSLTNNFQIIVYFLSSFFHSTNNFKLFLSSSFFTIGVVKTSEIINLNLLFTIYIYKWLSFKKLKTNQISKLYPSQRSWTVHDEKIIKLQLYSVQK